MLSGAPVSACSSIFCFYGFSNYDIAHFFLFMFDSFIKDLTELETDVVVLCTSALAAPGIRY